MKILKKILLAIPMLALFTNAYSYSRTFSAPTTSEYFWTKGLVNYKLDPNFTEYEKSIIKNSLNELASQVNADVPYSSNSDIVKRLSFNDIDTGGTFIISFECVKTNSCSRTDPSTWKPKGRVNEHIFYQHNYIYFKKTYSKGCNSDYVGMKGGEQVIQLSYNEPCIDRRVVLHETMHALGFHHEQQRYDHAQYIIINWDSIPKSWHDSNYKTLEAYSTRFGQYDYNSIMHYHSSTFSGYEKDDLTSINGNPILLNSNLSTLDIEGLRKAYPIINH